MITRTQLLEMRATYEAQKLQALMTANANQGAMEAIDQILALLEKEEENNGKSGQRVE